MASKYDALADRLREAEGARVTLEFAEVDRLVGGLPPSARTWRPWWGNTTGKSWLSAGWEVDQVNLTAERVRFRRSR